MVLRGHPFGRVGRRQVFLFFYTIFISYIFKSWVSNSSFFSIRLLISFVQLEDSTINTDSWKAYDGLILNGYDHHWVFHSHNESARGKCHVNGIANFWSFAKRRLTKFNGCKSDKFVIHLKECERHYNHRNDNLVIILNKNFEKKLIKSQIY